MSMTRYEVWARAERATPAGTIEASVRVGSFCYWDEAFLHMTALIARGNRAVVRTITATRAAIYQGAN